VCCVSCVVGRLCSLNHSLGACSIAPICPSATSNNPTVITIAPPPLKVQTTPQHTQHTHTHHSTHIHCTRTDTWWLMKGDGNTRMRAMGSGSTGVHGEVGHPAHNQEEQPEGVHDYAVSILTSTTPRHTSPPPTLPYQVELHSTFWLCNFCRMFALLMAVSKFILQQAC